MLHRVYLSPGMFGFTRLASYDYFVHIERALKDRFAAAGLATEFHISEILPTASIRRRANELAELVKKTSKSGDALHLLGHSTGGLDARMVVSPDTHLPKRAEAERWLPQVKSVTTMNTPHYGTPLASFFATTKGQQALSALSAFTVVGLSLGAKPLAIASVLIGMLGPKDRSSSIALPIVDRAIESLLGLVDDARSPDVRKYIEGIKLDQGAVMQLTPEAMDLFVASCFDRPGIVYQATASMAPTPKPSSWLRTLGHPWKAVSLALFTALHGITGRYDKRYPCAFDAAGSADDIGHHPDNEALLARTFAETPDYDDNDGCVPIRSQLRGKLIWVGLADHLDVLGHYDDETPEEKPEERHHDWLTSGSRFGDAAFESLMDAVAGGMLKA
ncbi:MAG: hypothetical protein ABI551_27175 [Polyangiaceae bacterium]